MGRFSHVQISNYGLKIECHTCGAMAEYRKKDNQRLGDWYEERMTFQMKHGTECKTPKA